jgi:hypothetical protein
MKELEPVLKIDNSNIESIEKSFSDIAEQLLNEYILEVDEKRFRIKNIEFYYYNEDIHKDTNSHCCRYKRAKQRQILCNEWYLHKISINRKNYFKGIDYTFGDGHNYGGILIKEVESLADGKVYYQSTFIDYVIKLLDPKTEFEFLKMVEDDKRLSIIKANNIVKKKIL